MVNLFEESESLKKKREDAIKYLGNKWILAKCNYVQKKPAEEVKGVLK